MKTNLLESYKGRLAVSESYFAKSHNGEKLSQNKKLVVAKLLENTNELDAMFEIFKDMTPITKEEQEELKKARILYKKLMKD